MSSIGGNFCARGKCGFSSWSCFTMQCASAYICIYAAAHEWYAVVARGGVSNMRQESCDKEYTVYMILLVIRRWYYESSALPMLC